MTRSHVNASAHIVSTRYAPGLSVCALQRHLDGFRMVMKLAHPGLDRRFFARTVGAFAVRSFLMTGRSSEEPAPEGRSKFRQRRRHATRRYATDHVLRHLRKLVTERRNRGRAVAPLERRREQPP